MITLRENILLKLSEFIASNLALYFPKNRWDDLERNIISASKEFGYADVESFIERITNSPLSREHAELLASHLTINETFFWREPKSFEALEQKILPDLINLRRKSDKRIRIWSAGCSSGEEPYSIAIALIKQIPDIKDWNIHILATDINPKILRKAAAGIYGQWSFRGVPSWLKEYFTKNDNNKYEIIPSIKSMVKFEYQNLAEDVFPSPLNNTNAMDIIYCRNVLMYFTQDRFRQVARGLYNALIEGGYLMVSASELSMLNFPDFIPVNVPGMVLYQKNSKKLKYRNKSSIIETPSAPLVVHVPEKPFVFDYELLKSDEIKQKEVPVHEVKLILVSAETAVEEIEKSKVDANASEKQILLIREYANQGKLFEALKSCEAAISAYKLDPRFHYLYATILQENNQMIEAVASHKRAIYLDQDFVLSYFSLGNIYKRMGNDKGAKKCFENSITILNNLKQDDIIFESEGLTAGRFKEIINASLQLNK